MQPTQKNIQQYKRNQNKVCIPRGIPKEDPAEKLRFKKLKFFFIALAICLGMLIFFLVALTA